MLPSPAGAPLGPYGLCPAPAVPAGARGRPRTGPGDPAERETGDRRAGGCRTAHPPRTRPADSGGGPPARTARSGGLWPRRIAGAAPPRTRRDGPDMLQPSRKQNEATATATAVSVPGRAWLMPALVTVGMRRQLLGLGAAQPARPALEGPPPPDRVPAVAAGGGAGGGRLAGADPGGRADRPVRRARDVPARLGGHRRAGAPPLARAGRDARTDPFLGGDSDRPTARVRRPDRPCSLPSRSPRGAVGSCRWVGHAGGGRCKGIGERLWWMSVVRGPVMPGCPRLCRSYVWMSCWRVCSGRWRGCGRRVTVFIRCWMRCW